MNASDYQKFYEQAGKRNGWDFSKVKCVIEGSAFHFYQEVAKRCRQSDLSNGSLSSRPHSSN